MTNKRINRREFLKAAIAGAAAAGLSHFRVLNFGSVVPVLADGCGNPPGTEDTCLTMLVDYCNPGEDQDICPDPNGGASSSDICVPDLMEPDVCEVFDGDPDLCDPIIPTEDICAPPPDADLCGQEGVPDICGEGPLAPDVCNSDVNNPDVCPDAAVPGGDGDICNVTGGNDSPDECIPAVNESDLCSPETGTDFCRNPATSIVEPDNCADPDPDICYEGGQNVVDICADPDPDTPPNSVSLASFTGQSASSLGVTAAAVLGGAALLLRNNEPKPRDKDEPAV